MKRIPFLFLSCKLLFLILAIEFSHGQTTLILQPDSVDGKDAYISSHFPTLNRGSHRGIHSLGWTVNGNVSIGRSLFQFDLTSIPAGSTVINAELSLYNDPGNNIVLTNGQHSNSTASNTSYISRVLGAWDEYTLTWNNQPSYTTIDQVTLPQSTSPNQDYLNINVTDMVQQMVDLPAQNHGFILRLANEIHYCALIFASSDNPDPSNHPKLEITYSPFVGINVHNDTRPVINMHPNPSADGKIRILREDYLEFEHIRIIDLAGQQLDPLISMGTEYVTLNIDAPAGMYVVHGYYSSGYIATGKFILHSSQF